MEKHEKQTRNAIEIATKAGALHDSFVGLAKDLLKIEKALDNAQTSYDDAMKKVKTGRGNLVKKVLDIKDLGAKTKKQLDVALVEAAQEDQ